MKQKEPFAIQMFCNTWDDWYTALSGRTTKMYKHQLIFDSFLNKHIAQLWIGEHIETIDSDECLTELKLQFYTDIALSVHQQKELVKAVQPIRYFAEEL